MIYQLNGSIADIIQNLVVVDVNGVGYGVSVPDRLVAKSLEVGKDVKLLTITIVSQDNIQLCGFTSPLDRQFFQMLLNIPRIGPKGALKILSSAPAVEIMQVILAGDEKKLSKIPGIGAKVAQRLVLELREKVSSVLEKAHEDEEDPVEDTVEVLVGLGCSPAEARLVLAKVQKENQGKELSFDDLLSHAMKMMAEEELQ